MSTTTKGFARCESGQRYVQQLVKHWAHKFETSFDGREGHIIFSDATRASFAAGSDGVTVQLTTATAEEHKKMLDVIERHLDRFAFREAPLAYRWSDA